MATNYVQPGEVVEYTNAGQTTIASGDLVPLSNHAGIALVDIAASATGSVALTGVYTVEKTTGATWSVGQALYVDAGTGKATTVSTGNVPAGFAFAAALTGATSGQLLLGGQLALAQAAEVTALTDNSGGATADGTLAANGACSIISIPVTLANIADGDLVTTFTPGFAGTILRAQFVVTTAVTTGDKAADLNLEIGTTNVTGGVVALTSATATPVGKTIAGTAITDNATFTASDTISVEAANTVAFQEGAGVLLITVASDTVDNNTKDLATTVNAILTALKDGGLMASS
jgi:predicted RecA/RadA family phage recombinase